MKPHVIQISFANNVKLAEHGLGELAPTRPYELGPFNRSPHVTTVLRLSQKAREANFVLSLEFFSRNIYISIMPEIGEVARAVFHLQKHLKGRKIARIRLPSDDFEDPKIFQTAKTGLTCAHFASTLAGKTVVDAKRQGKYFWLEMDTPPHPLLHFSMAGWFRFKDDAAADYREMKEKDKKGSNEIEWPPRFWKFIIETDDGPKVEAAFTDMRRFSAVRLIDAPAEEMRNTSPLKENGPDPVLDKDILTKDWLAELLNKKHVPVKALLLDQANISGIGNWVADEILYQARIHPEQYSNTLTDQQMTQLHNKLTEVCTTACDLLAESDKFPADWLMKHRWDKGKKDADNRLPNGEKIVHVTVGGRTSAIVPSVQKKTGPVAGDVKEESIDRDVEKSKPRGSKKQSKTNSKVKQDDDDKHDRDHTEDGAASEMKAKTIPAKKSRVKSKAKASKEEIQTHPINPPGNKAKAKQIPSDEPGAEVRMRGRKRKAPTTKGPNETEGVKATKVEESQEAVSGRRRSGRNQGK